MTGEEGETGKGPDLDEIGGPGAQADLDLFARGLGIALGDDCVVEAGLYVTAGTKVTGPDGTQIKARDLSGQSNLLFRRNSLTGAVEVVPWKGDGIALNEMLHKHN